MFARPGPLGRLARAVLSLKNKATIRDLNTPWAKGPANFLLRGVLGVHSLTPSILTIHFCPSRFRVVRSDVPFGPVQGIEQISQGHRRNRVLYGTDH